MNAQLIQEQYYNKRSVNSFINKEVSDETIKNLYELTSLGSTAFNAQPARFVFLKSQSAKERLKPFLSAGNIEKTMKAPLVVIIATDYEFYDLLNKTFPIADVKGLFTSNKEMSDVTAFRNSTLSGAYLMKAAHALGLDTGPMSGFDNAGVDKEFFSGSGFKSNFIVNIGYGTTPHEHLRLPRLSFEEAAEIF